jgi:hypothetical protein
MHSLEVLQLGFPGPPMLARFAKIAAVVFAQLYILGSPALVGWIPAPVKVPIEKFHKETNRIILGQ